MGAPVAAQLSTWNFQNPQFFSSSFPLLSYQQLRKTVRQVNLMTMEEVVTMETTTLEITMAETTLVMEMAMVIPETIMEMQILAMTMETIMKETTMATETP